jgi:uncharacterized protein
LIAGEARTSAFPHTCAAATSTIHDNPAVTTPLEPGEPTLAPAGRGRLAAISITYEIRRPAELGPRSRRAADESYSNRKGIPAPELFGMARLKCMPPGSCPSTNALPALVVLAKAPQPGLSKTRLCPPLSPQEAARLAELALVATLEAALSTPACRPLLVLEGPIGDWTPRIDVLPQRGHTLGERLTAAFEDAGGPTLVVGMDTPQVTPEMLAGGLDQVLRPDFDAVLGPTSDGGYWAVGLKEAQPQAFVDVPMSTPWTEAAQRASFERLALRCASLPELSDFDLFSDARRVALEMPGSEFSRAVWRLSRKETSAWSTVSIARGT